MKDNINLNVIKKGKIFSGIARTFVQSGGDDTEYLTPTLKHIAKEARVSFQTVSHALNNTGRVSQKTRSKIQKIAAKIQYRPNAIARGLKSKRTKTLGIIFPCIYDNEFYAGIYRGIEDMLLEFDYNIILCNSDFKVDREAKCLSLLMEKRVDGIVLALALGKYEKYENTPIIRNVIKKMPVILIDRCLPELETDYVGYDNVGGAYEAVEHLIKLGHKRIGCIIGPRVSAALERFEGYKKALEKYGIVYDEQLVKWFEHPTKYDHSVVNPEGYYCAKELLKQDTVTAIFAVNDAEAIGVMRAIEEEGLRIPDDIVVVGYEDMRIASHLPVPLTTVRQDIRKMGQSVARVFLDRISGKVTNEIKKIIIQNHLVIRESCGAKLNKEVIQGLNLSEKEVTTI